MGLRYYQEIAVNRVLEASPLTRAHPADLGHGHRQDLDRVSDCMEAVQGRWNFGA